MTETFSTERSTWAVNAYPWRETQELANALGLPPVVATVLAGRGLTDAAEAKAFLECSYPLPDPFLFGHMEGAVAAISIAVEQGGRIVIHGDYDADGITATALMVRGLRDLGVQAEWYLPSRFNEGFGLSRTAVEAIAAGGPGMLVTVDCGVNYPDEVALAQKAGLDVVVIDHHRPGPVLPACHLIHQVVGDYPHGDLCGVGLALKVMHALHIRLAGAARETLPEALHGLLDLVALGTVADLAPLQGENRYYVREGLKLIAIGQRVGLRALATVSGCAGVADSGTIAYRLAPRLNAAGRLADASPPLRLLLTEDEREAAELAGRLHELNGARQEVERRILEQALQQVEGLGELPPAIVLAGQEWHEGVVGIVASRLVERYHRPTILLGVREEVAKGSGRSISAYDLMAGLNASADLLTVYGGHRQAVGLTLQAERVDDFRRAVEEHAGRVLDARDLTPVYRADAVLGGFDMTAETALALTSLGPFGGGNPRPRFLLAGACIQDAEATRNGAHLRCNVQVDGVKARGIGFGMGAMTAELRESPAGRLIGAQFQVDEWQGVPRPEFLIERIGAPEGGTTGADDHALGWGGAGPAEERWDQNEVENGADEKGADEIASLDMPPVRDLRDRQGLSTAVAQVLATGERVLIVDCSVPHALSALRARVPLGPLAGGQVAPYCRGCLGADRAAAAAAGVVLADWDTAVASPWLRADRAHIVAVGPPYRARHVMFLRSATAEGAVAHLCYGEEERRSTVNLLRYLVHPRFAMVCVYRAVQENDSPDDRVLGRAREIGWEEAGVLLAPRYLERARAILGELGIERSRPGEAKLDARSIPTYVTAEADYQECSRLCLTL